MESAQELKLFAEASLSNQAAAKHFGIAVGGLIGLFTVGHWAQRFSRRKRGYAKLLDGVFTQRLKGHLVPVPAYLAINIILTFTNVNWTIQTFLAKRLGWMALCNLCVAVFLGLKNTPLSPLTGKSYESINVLHRYCGYTTILYMVLHSTVYVSGLYKVGALFVLMDPKQYAAATAGLSLLVLLMSTLIRKRQYELFVTLHLCIVALVLATDRSLRLSRWILNGYGNHCTLTPLPGNATKITMGRSIKASPGSHAFVWIPSIKLVQTHPFTLISNDPAEFIVHARDGFTKALFTAAVKAPGKALRAAIEGPYGHMPNIARTDKLILIAGGSGVTFTMSLALHWAKQARLHAPQPSTLEFVWAVRSRAHLRWFQAELTELQAHPAVNVCIYVTGASSTDKHDTAKPEPLRSMLPAHVAGRCQETFELDERVENMFSSSLSVDEVNGLPSPCQYGRPDAGVVLDRAVVGMSRTDRLLVAVCGPAGMLTDARVATRKLMRTNMPAIQLHLEEFGW
ncbi:hypothetical protein LTR22_024979 [Elasticomyces elasticus]|nr:hypothetical protein LTR22_024979 [Elasticomyces elasticus]KAK4909416.1 hypothetical protein LTR49_021817 [Elasticomyces elasticus]KAK5749337.1 hypothetical protein LTS12_020592 [Elasticomyces elasticus]